MNRRVIPLGFGITGVLLIAAAGWLYFTTTGLMPGDDAMALANIAEIPLDSIQTEGSLSIRVIIPATPKWARIRNAWGEPDFIITAVSELKPLAYLTDLGIRVDVMKRGIPIRVDGFAIPYGYSSNCSTGNFRFRAAPGSEMTLVSREQLPLRCPLGDLIVVGSWWNTKDKLVGVALDEELHPVLIDVSISGLILILAALVIAVGFGLPSGGKVMANSRRIPADLKKIVNFLVTVEDLCQIVGHESPLPVARGKRRRHLVALNGLVNTSASIRRSGKLRRFLI